MKRTILAAFSISFVAGLIAQTPAPPVFRLSGLAGGAFRNAPFSADAVTETTRTLGDGNRIVRRTAQKLYRDSDGRERREQYASTGGTPDSVAISDPVAGTAFTLHPEQRNALQTARVAIPPYGLTRNLALFPIEGQTAPLLVNGPPAAKEDLGTRNLEGVNTQGMRMTQTIPAGEVGNLLPIRIVDESWYSPELRMNVMTTHSDPRTGEIVYKLTNISRANPPRSLFEIPSDYTIQGVPAVAGGRSLTLPAQR